MSRVGLAARALAAALLLAGCGAKPPPARPFVWAPTPASRPASAPAPAPAAVPGQPAARPPAPAPVDWAPVPAAELGRAAVRGGGLRFAVKASVRGAPPDLHGVEVEVTITNYRLLPIEIGCQPLLFDGAFGSSAGWRPTWDRGSFGEGGPLFVGWAHGRIERIAPGGSLAVKRTWPQRSSVDAQRPGDAVRLWLRASSLCLHEVAPRPDADGVTRTAVFPKQDVDLATLTLSVPERVGKPRLTIESGRRSRSQDR